MEIKPLAEIAAQYIGIKEIPNNMGWDNKEFERKMIDVGWTLGWAYCALFAKLCTLEFLAQFDSAKFLQTDVLSPLFSPMATVSYNRFKKAGYTAEMPGLNTLVVWQHYENGEPQPTGHMAILKSFENGNLNTIDGNTNLAGSREGDGIYEKNRTLKENVITGLKFLGFINLPNFQNDINV
jgi:hypothetical protein